MLGSVGFNLAYVLMSTTNNYCLHRLDVAMRELGAGPEDTIVMTFDATSILEIRTTELSKVIVPDPTSSSTINPNSTSISTSAFTSTSISISTTTTTSTSITSTTPSTTVSAGKSATTSTSTVTSTTYPVGSTMAAIESSATLEPLVPEPARDGKSHKAAEPKVAVKSQATLDFPVRPGLPAPPFELSKGSDWVAIYEHGKEQKHPFNISSKAELEDLQWTTAGLFGLRRELKDVAKVPSKRSAQANGLEEVLTFVAITPLQNMSKIVLELQGRFVEYNTNKPHRASDSMRMGPFIENALEQLSRTKPRIEGLSANGVQALDSLINFDKADSNKYCFNNNCEWRARVLNSWRDVDRKRDFFAARLADVNEQLIAIDEAEWQTVLWAIRTFKWMLPIYTVLLIIGRLFSAGWPIYPRKREDKPAQAAAPDDEE